MQAVDADAIRISFGGENTPPQDGSPTPKEEDNGKHVMEQTRFDLIQDEILCKMHDEAVRKEFGDEGVAILNSSRS